MPHPLMNQFRPFGIVFGRIGPAGVILIEPGARRPGGTIGFGLGGESFRHEADLDEWFRAGAKVGFEDAIRNGPVVDRLAVSIFAIGVG